MAVPPKQLIEGQDSLRLVTWISALIVFFGLLVTAVRADAGRIVDFEGSVVLLRSGVQVRMTLGLPLLAGDQVVVSGPGFLIFSAGAKETRVDAAASPFVVAEASSEPFPDVKMAETVTDLMSWWGNDEDVQVRSRDTLPPELAALPADATAFLLSGKRTLRLAPMGGKGPFVLEMFSAGMSIGSVELRADEQAAYLDVDLLPATDYEIAVRDLGQGDRQSVYKVTTATALPGFAGADRLTSTNKFDRLLAAGGLSSTQNGLWAFEAVQQINGMNWPVRASAALMIAIESGDHP